MRLRIQEDGIRTIVEEGIHKSLTACMQCSKCGGGCAHVDEFDLSPRQVIEYLLDGLDEQVLDLSLIHI